MWVDGTRTRFKFDMKCITQNDSNRNFFKASAYNVDCTFLRKPSYQILTTFYLYFLL